MNRQELIAELKSRLTSLPQSEIDKTVSFYDEMIEDRMEDGMSEEDAVAGLGSVDSIVENCMLDISIPTLMKSRLTESKQKAKNKGLWTFLIILGSPVWFPLLLAGLAVLFAVYVTAWSVIVSFYAALVSFAAGAVAGVLGGIVLFFVKSPQIGLCFFGCGLVCAALMIFLIQPMKMVTKKMVELTKVFARKVKSLIIRKGGEDNE